MEGDVKQNVLEETMLLYSMLCAIACRRTVLAQKDVDQISFPQTCSLSRLLLHYTWQICRRLLYLSSKFLAFKSFTSDCEDKLDPKEHHTHYVETLEEKIAFQIYHIDEPLEL